MTITGSHHASWYDSYTVRSRSHSTTASQLWSLYSLVSSRSVRLQTDLCVNDTVTVDSAHMPQPSSLKEEMHDAVHTSSRQTEGRYAGQVSNPVWQTKRYTGHIQAYRRTQQLNKIETIQDLAQCLCYN
jgi:hypothetical protein